jgi:hypothetical protein
VPALIGQAYVTADKQGIAPFAEYVHDCTATFLVPTEITSFAFLGKEQAVASPMPEVPPVMSTTLFRNR